MDERGRVSMPWPVVVLMGVPAIASVIVIAWALFSFAPLWFALATPVVLFTPSVIVEATGRKGVPEPRRRLIAAASMGVMMTVFGGMVGWLIAGPIGLALMAVPVVSGGLATRRLLGAKEGAPDVVWGKPREAGDDRMTSPF